MLLFSIILITLFFVANHFIKGQDDVEEVALVIPDAPEQTLLQAEVLNAPVIVEEQGNDLPKVKTYKPLVASSESKKSNKVNYSFYEGLAASEVVVDVEPISIKLKSPYFIQAGTFRKEADAKQEQARLLRHGQHLFLFEVTSRDKKYYRLRMGPYEDRLKMNKKRNELRRLGVDTLLVKAKYAASKK